MGGSGGNATKVKKGRPRASEGVRYVALGIEGMRREAPAGKVM